MSTYTSHEKDNINRLCLEDIFVFSACHIWRLTYLEHFVRIFLTFLGSLSVPSTSNSTILGMVFDLTFV